MGPLKEGIADPALELEGLSFRYGDRPALDRVTLRVAPGSVVALLGPNGSGKTTLLRILAGRLPRGAGRLRVLGAEPPLGREIRRRSSYTPAETVHREALTGRENVLFFGRARGLEPDEAASRADLLLERFGLAGRADEPVADYSRGMKRKLLLVEGLLHDPELLLLDEPFTGLDPDARDAAHRELRERAARGAVAVLATHALERVPSLADRVVLLHRGTVVADDAPASLLARIRGRGRARVRVRSESRTRPELPRPYRVDASDGTGAGGELVLRVSWPADRGDLTDLVRALAATDADLLELRVEEPDLSHVFRRLTGRSLGPPGNEASR